MNFTLWTLSSSPDQYAHFTQDQRSHFSDCCDFLLFRLNNGCSLWRTLLLASLPKESGWAGAKKEDWVQAQYLLSVNARVPESMTIRHVFVELWATELRVTQECGFWVTGSHPLSTTGLANNTKKVSIVPLFSPGAASITN